VERFPLTSPALRHGVYTRSWVTGRTRVRAGRKRRKLASTVVTAKMWKLLDYLFLPTPITRVLLSEDKCFTCTYPNTNSKRIYNSYPLRGDIKKKFRRPRVRVCRHPLSVSPSPTHIVNHVIPSLTIRFRISKLITLIRPTPLRRTRGPFPVWAARS